MTRIRMVVADDHTLFRAGIAMLLESQVDLELVGTAATGIEAVEVVVRTRPDVVLMDIRMPDLDGIRATARIVAAGIEPAPRVLVVTTFRRDEAVAEAIRAGASGFVMKDAEPEFLLSAIRTVHAGRAVIAPAETFDLFRHFGRAQRPVDDTALDPLSVREKEIFLLTAKGCSNAEIAAQAFVSETTVKSHVSSILLKLGLTSRVQIVAFAWERGLVG